MKTLVLIPSSVVVKNVVRDLVYGCWCGGKRIGGMQMPPLNLLYVSTVLRENGHEVEFVDAAVDYDSFLRVRRRIREFGVVVILSSTNSFRTDVETIRELKEMNPDLVSILFGSHPTFMPEYCLREDCVDVIVRREPEFIIRDLVNALDGGGDWRRVRGIGCLENGRQVLNDYYPLIDDLDDLPIPDRGLLSGRIDYFNPVVKRMPYTTMQTSRGCPARCNFCTVPTFYGRKIRSRSAGRVIEEMLLLRSMGYREIFFRDETFTVFRKRNAEICNFLIRRNADISWICNARVDRIDRESVHLMKKAGCHMIKFGVESGNQEILDNIRKGITLEQTREAFRICHEAGMDAHAHVMLACPGENRDTILRTLKFVKEIDPTTVSFGIHTPYPGTELFERVSAEHPEIMDGSDASMEKLHIQGFFNQSFTDLTQDEIERSVRRAYRSFYFRPGYLLRRLLSIRGTDELMRWVIAGSNIFSFGMNRE